MSNQFLKLRRSAVPGRVPSTSSIDFGEIALNTFDGLAFIKRSGSMGEEVITLGSREGAFTGSFSGSFVGNGGGLFNIPASGIVGLNLSQIATGSVTASVSTGAGSFSLVSGSSTFLYVSSSGNVGIGTSTPTAVLTVNGNDNNQIQILDEGGSVGYLYGSANGGYMQLVSSRSALNIVSSGRVAVTSTIVGNGTVFGVSYGANTFVVDKQSVFGSNVLLGTINDSGERLQVSGSSRFAGNMVVTGSATITNGDLSVFKSSQPTINFQDQTGFNNGYQNASFGIWSSSSKNFLINVWGKTAISANSHNFNNTGLSTVTLNSTGLNGFVDTNGGHSLVIPFSSTTQRALTIVRTENTTNTAGYDAIRLSSATYGTYTFFRVDDIGNIYSRGNGIFGSETSFGSERLQVSGSARITDGLSVTGSITANNITVTGTLTAQTIVAQTITSSTDYVSGSTIFGNSLSNTHQFTGSVSITGSLSLPYLSTGSVLFAGANGTVSQDNSNFFWDNTNGRLGIGTNAPGDTFQIGTNIAGTVQVRKIAVNDTTTTDFSNSAHFNANIATARTSFTISNSSSTSWVNNFTAISVVGASHPNNYYLTNISGKTSDAGYSMIINQGNQSNGLLIGTFDADPIYFGTNNTARVAITANGNVLLASTSDSGERLQVLGSSRFIGDMVITGSGNTSATNGLTIQNSTSANIFNFRNDGTQLLSTVASQTIPVFSIFQRVTTTNNGSYVPIIRYGNADVGQAVDFLGYWDSANVGGFRFQHPSGTGGGVTFSFLPAINIISSNVVTINQTFNPTSGTATNTQLILSPTINQTGGANGITRGIYINPTITAAADFRTIEWSTNASTSPSASWGLYGSGSAPNFLSGSLLIGSTSNTGERLQVIGSARITNGLVVTGSTTIVGDVSTGNTVTIGGATGGAGILSFFNGNVGISRSGASGLLFRVGSNAIAATITSDRLVGIGTESPAALLHVTGSNQGLFLIGGTAGSNILYVSSSGNVGIGTNAPSHTVHLVGATGDILRITNGVRNGYVGVTNNTVLFTTSANGAGAGFTMGGDGTNMQLNASSKQILNVLGATGNVLIQNGGTFTDDGVNRLQVSGSARITDGLSVTGSITANSITVTGTLTAQTIVAQTITSSILYSSGSNIFGNSLSNTQDFTGSVRITGSLQVTGDTVLRGSGATSATNALLVLNSLGNSLFTVKNDGLSAINGNLIISSIFPYLQLSVSGWGASSYIQSGVNLAANAAGDYTLFLNPASKGFAFLQGSNVSMVFAPTTNNVTIGATTDTGERFQVSGSSKFAGNMVITGSGATSATNAFIVQNSSGANILRARSDGAVYIESVGSVAQLFFSGNDAQIQRSTSGLNGLGMYGPANASHTLTISSFSSDNYGNGALSSLRFSGNFVSSTGNTAFSYMLLNGTINQTGTSTSIVRGLYINPTITAAADFRAIEWSNNTATAPSQSWGLYGAGSAPNYLSGSLLIGSTTNTGERLQVTGTARISQALTASAAIISGSGTQRLTVVGSGSAQPLFTVQGSQGELFSIVDSLSGSLFSVNDQSGLPIMEVFSDNTILMGNYLDPMLLTTARTGSAVGINTLYTLPTSSYDAVYIDYTIRSGSNARAGNFMAMWSGTSVNFTDNSITEFGTTSGFVFGAHISGSNMVVTGSSSTSGWTVKTIIKAI